MSCKDYWHECASITCPACGSDNNCWDCAVRYKDDSAGKGDFICQECGYTARYENGEVIS